MQQLATGDILTTIVYTYWLQISTGWMIIIDVCKALCKCLVPVFMSQPNQDEWKLMANKFHYRLVFPNCVGAIDGKHVILQAPANTGAPFFINIKGISPYFS